MWIMNIPVVSTAHLPVEYESDFKDAGLTVAAYPEGCFVRLAPPCMYRLPKAYKPLIRYAKAQGWDWIRFDGGIGDMVDGLKTFDW